MRARESTVRIDVIIPETGMRPVPSGRSPTLYRASNGSGFVADATGRIITAAHVVRDAVVIKVVTLSGAILPARLLGFDEASDVAVLEVSGEELANELPSPLMLATQQLPVGAPIAAIGAPYGMNGSVTFGTVNGNQRARRESAPAILLQHDAAINPGNSGGPVVGPDGTVVGLNVAIPDGQFEFAGISLAVEALLVARIAAEIIASGEVGRGVLGATLRALDPLVDAAIETSPSAAAVVVHVAPEGPAARGGLAMGDLVEAIDGTPVHELDHLLRQLDDHRVGDLVTLTVRTGVIGPVRDVAVRLDAPADSVARPAVVAAGHGLEFAPGGPAKVARVASGSLAHFVGIAPGDVVHSIDLVAVPDGAAAQARLAATQGLTALLVSRGEDTTRLLVLGTDSSDAGTLGGNNIGLLSAIR